jgi:hypothetical protein
MSDMTITGETLERLLAEAMAKRSHVIETKVYDAYERRASAYMVRRRQMPDSERADTRYFQCRACGWNPYDDDVRRWFWALAFTCRRDLVRLSRVMHVPFYGEEVE